MYTVYNENTVDINFHYERKTWKNIQVWLLETGAFSPKKKTWITFETPDMCSGHMFTGQRLQGGPFQFVVATLLIGVITAYTYGRVPPGR